MSQPQPWACNQGKGLLRCGLRVKPGNHISYSRDCISLSSTLFFLLKAFIRNSTAAFFLFSNAIYISSLILFTLAGGFCEFSLVDKQILKEFSQYQGRLTCVLSPFIFLNILIPPIQFTTQIILYNYAQLPFYSFLPSSI